MSRLFIICVAVVALCALASAGGGNDRNGGFFGNLFSNLFGGNDRNHGRGGPHFSGNGGSSSDDVALGLGTCPPANNITLATCNSTCTVNGNCTASQYCCTSSCGALACVAAVARTCSDSPCPTSRECFTNTSITCAANATFCEQFQCLRACRSGTYRNLTSGACVACPNNCTTCSINSTTGNINCTSCSGATYLYNNTCNNACSTGCRTCVGKGDGSSNCTSCTTATYLFNNTCTNCSANCNRCVASGTANGGSNCTSCSTSNYFLANNTCAACAANCNRCNSATSCQSCATGYYAQAGTPSCAACATNCASCGLSRGVLTCFECNRGYRLKKGVCN